VVIKTYVEEKTAPLIARITEIEKSGGGLGYCGVYQAALDYKRGSMVTLDGAFWHANRDTRERPGSPGGAWTLAVKALQK